MKKHHQWLLDEINAWRTEGIIDGEQARRLSARYDQAEGGEWGKLIFTGLGAVIFGLGILLFIAYNWQGMDRFIKLALIGLSLLLAHGCGWWLSRPAGQHQRIGESLHLLGTLLFGGGIWLVAQIYHLDEHYPNAYLVWSLGALSLAWAIPSVAQGMLALALVFMWGWFEVFDFHHPNHWGPWLVAVGVIPLAWLQRSRVLLFFSLCLFMALYAFSIARVDDDLVFAVLFMIAGGYLGLARLAPRTSFVESAPVFQMAGAAVYLLLLFIGSFGGMDGDLFEDSPDGVIAWLYWSAPMLLGVSAWGATLLVRGERRSWLEHLESGLIVITLLIVIGASLGIEGIAQMSWLPFNLIFLAHGAVLVALGVRLLRWQWVSLGGLMVAALIFARFLDLFDSLLLRALAFTLLGALVFGVGLRFSKQKKQLSQQEASHE